MSLAMEMRYKVEINGPLKEIPAQTLLVEGDKAANRVVLEIVQDGKPADLTDCTALAYFVRQTGDKVRVEGVIDGNVVSITLSEHCYYVPGAYAFLVSLKHENEQRTVLWLTGRMASNGEGRLVDPESTLPSVEELEQYIKEMDEALATSEQATARANEAADAAQEFVGLTVTATTLPSGQAATAAYADGVLTLGLPRGEKGDTGSAAAMKVNGVEGVDDNITITGENIALAAEKPETVAAAIADIRSQPKFAWNPLDNSDFRRTVNQRGNTSYQTVGYTVDRWNMLDAGICDVADNCLHITCPSTLSYTRLVQVLDMALAQMAGKQYTLAWMDASGNIGAATGTVPAAAAGEDTNFIWGNTATRSSVAAFLRADGLIYVQIAVEPEVTESITWVALYEGEYTADNLPAYTPKGYAHELLECQRYYQRIPISRQSVYCSATTGAVSLTLPTAMRTSTPTVNAIKMGSIRCNGSAAITVTGISLAQLSGNMLWLDTTHASTSGIATYTGTWNGGEVELVAEL